MIFDLSGNGNAGILMGNTCFSPGKFGDALFFDGSGDYAKATKARDIFGNLSVSFYLNLCATTFYQRFLVYYLDSTHYIQVTYNGSSEPICVSGKFNSPTEYARRTGPGIVAVGVWVHVLVTYNGTIRIFLNGVQQTDYSTSGWGIGTNTGLTLGMRNDYSSNPFNGYIDIPLIWNRALSTAEVAYLYREPFCMFDVIWTPKFAAAAPPAISPKFFYLGKEPRMKLAV